MMAVRDKQFFVGSETLQHGRQTGAALIIVLGLVSVMSVTAVVAFDMFGMFVRKTTNSQIMSQAREYALAGEILGAKRAGAVIKANELFGVSDAINDTDNGLKVDMPIDGGRIKGALKENTNCFNLSTLVSKLPNGSYVANVMAMQQFSNLLQAMGIGKTEAASLTAALTDWQDSDTRPLPMGAESAAYNRLDPPYRTSDSRLVSIKDLRLIRDFSVDLIDALTPLVCIDPLDTQTVLNINTLQPHHSVLVKALLGDAVTIQQASQLIASRPRGGYDHNRRFWQMKIFEGKAIPEAVRGQFITTPRRFLLTVDVRLNTARTRLNSALHFNPDGSYIIISRYFGA